MSVMISAIGVSYLLQNLAYYVTGGVPKQYPELPWISDTITILGASTKRVTVITPDPDAGAGRGARGSHQAHEGSAWPCAQPPKTLKRRS